MKETYGKPNNRKAQAKLDSGKEASMILSEKGYRKGLVGDDSYYGENILKIEVGALWEVRLMNSCDISKSRIPPPHSSLGACLNGVSDPEQCSSYSWCVFI